MNDRMINLGWKRWIGIMLSWILVLGNLALPVFGAEKDSSNQETGGGSDFSDTPELIWNNHVYKVSSHTASFADAKKQCESAGGHLATIMSPEENAAITEYLCEYYEGGSYMIGLYDEEGSNGKWDTWVTGEPVIYQNWGSGQPDWEGQTICAINSTANSYYRWEVGEWDNGWDGDYAYLCEWDNIGASLSVTREKGKTLLNVHYPQSQENPTEYVLTQKNMDTDEEKTIAVLQSSSETGDEEDRKNTVTYDFSTQLNLQSGTYQFTLIDQKASEDLESSVTLSYVYDENEKIAEDDEFGNEREYRRLLANSDSPLGNKQFTDNIRQRLTNIGLSSDKIDTIIEDIKNAEDPYKSLFLYSFYKYSFEESNKSQFVPEENKVAIDESVLLDLVSEAEFYTTFFHESGHAIDWNACDDGYYTAIVNWDHNLDLYIEDTHMIVSRLLGPWFEENGDSVVCTEDELAEKIFGHLFNNDPKITRKDCGDLSEDEYKAYKYVEKSLQDEMSIISSFKNGDNLDMTDVLMGLTANKIAPIFLGSKIVGHPTDYWWTVDEKTGVEQMTSGPYKEGWTECFTALFLGNEEMIESNECYFPLTCEYYKTMAGTLLSYYQNTF